MSKFVALPSVSGGGGHLGILVKPEHVSAIVPQENARGVAPVCFLYLAGSPTPWKITMDHMEVIRKLEASEDA